MVKTFGEFPRCAARVRAIASLGMFVVAVLALSPIASASATENSGAVKSCASDQLVATLSRTGAALGHDSMVIALTNDSRRTCSLKGISKIQMMNEKGTAIPTHENLEASYFPYLSYPIRRVILKPTKDATIDVGYTDATGFETDQCPMASDIKITPPDNVGSLTLAIRLEPFGEGTLKKHQCGEIAVSPVMTTQ